MIKRLWIAKKKPEEEKMLEEINRMYVYEMESDKEGKSSWG